MSEPRSSPAAVTACGYVEVSVMPGATLTSRNHGRPSASTMRSLRDSRAARASRCTSTAVVGAGGQHVVGQPGGHEELGGAGGVARAVVVEAAVGHDLDHGQGARAAAVVDHRDGHLGAGDEALDERGVAVGERGHHRAGQVGGGAHDRGAERRAAARRLHHERQAEARDDGVEHRAGAELAEGRRRPARTSSGTATPAARTRAEATGLSNDERQACGVGADVRQAERLEHVAHGAVLAGCAVQQRDDARRAARRRASRAGRRRRRARRRRRRSARSASATRRPERSDTSRSGESPPARTTTRPSALLLIRRDPLCELTIRVSMRVPAHARSGRGADGPSRSTSGAATPNVCGELELGLDHAGEAAHALADAVGLGVAVRQAQRLAALAVGVEAGAGHVGHERGDRARQHRGGVEARRAASPTSRSRRAGTVQVRARRA